MAALGDKLRNLSADLSRMAEEFAAPPSAALPARRPTPWR